MDNFIEFLYAKFLQSDGVSIDTRTIRQDNLFFAVSGPHFNANTFAHQALEKGASFAVVDDPQYATNDRVILVEDSLKALQDLATFHRSRFRRKVLAITGSNGKTTTKELVSAALSKRYIVHSTPGNYNNHIGVPLTLLHIHPQVEIAIIEMGANHVGEIAALCEIARPDFGLITNIGKAHSETFGGVEGIIRGKSELFDYLRKTGGTPFINGEDQVLSNMTKRFSAPVIFPEKDLQLTEASPYLKVSLGGKSYATELTGAYNFLNIASAVSISRYFDVPDDAIGKAVSTYVPENARSQIIQHDSTTIILDAYNANPDSMQAALINLSNFRGKRVAILGDMKEIENPEAEHKAVVETAADLKIDSIITCGPSMEATKHNTDWFADKKSLRLYLNKQSFADCTVLLKASRSMKFEDLVDSIN